MLRDAPLHVAFANARYRAGDTRGGNAHVAQFIHQSACLGHEIWLWPGSRHPEARTLPRGKVSLQLSLRRMDVLYTRLQEQPPAACRYTLPPWKQIAGSPLVVWEFNTVPEFHFVMGRGQAEVQAAISAFRRFGAGCDLAVCVSNALNDYVRHNLGIRQVITVPNGSDPERFRPDAPRPAGLHLDPDQLNVVWLGSGDLAWHDLDTLEQTAAHLAARGAGKTIQFHVIGQAGDARGDSPPNLHFHGPVPYTELPGWLAGMDVGLCLYRPGPADYSSPLKLFDYLASGLAVVSLYQPQVEEVLDKLGQRDLLVPAGDSELLARLLLELQADREGTRRRGLAGRKLVCREYTWRKSVETIYTQIWDLLEQRRGKRR